MKIQNKRKNNIKTNEFNIKIMDLHLVNLENIIRSFDYPLEGNCFYMHGTLTRSDELIPKQQNLSLVAKHGTNILEIGFNAGHSALLFLMSNPKCNITVFDIAHHPYTKPCYEYLDSCFPNRLKAHWGNSRDTLPRFIADNNGEVLMDLIHVDGSHQEDDVIHDVNACRLLRHANTWVIFDDYDFLYQTYLKLKDVVLEEGPLILQETPMYKHVLCTYVKPSIAIVLLILGEDFKKKVYPGTLGKVAYCIQHGYDLIMDPSLWDEARPHAWSKLLVILTYLNRYETIVWMDSDTHILNFDTTLELLIERYMDEQHDILVSKDWKIINTGVVFLKNTEFSRQFIAQVNKNKEFIHDGNWEQTAFIQLYDENYMDAQTKISVVYHICFNSYWYNYAWGHFLIHFAGDREGVGFRMKQYCPIRLEDDTQEEYDNRLQWIEHDSQKYNMDLLNHIKQHELD
jgi:hypothetical protein